MENEVDSKEIERLTPVHIQRYSHQLTKARAGVAGYREEENKKYLDIWESIKAKGFDWKKLDAAEKQEIWEAVESGE